VSGKTITGLLVPNPRPLRRLLETAEALAISKGSVESTHFRARKRLAYTLRGTSGPLSVEGCRVLDMIGKQSVGNATRDTIAV
jgi:hypothetical protein